MQKWLSSKQIPQQEAKLSVLLSSYLFLIISNLLIIKPISNALFLQNVGIQKLPHVFILVAVCSGLVVFSYNQIKKSVFTLTKINIYVSISLCFLFWYSLCYIEQTWIYYTFYVWVAIFGVITVSQFWLLCNHLMTTRQAKKYFSFIGAGGIAGGISSGYLVDVLSEYTRPSNLIFACIGSFLICIWILSRLKGNVPNKEKTFESKSSDISIRDLFTQKHLSRIALVVGLSILTATIADYLFRSLASQHYTNASELTAFFGFWQSTISVLALVIQMLFTNKLLQRGGVLLALCFLPMMMLGGSLSIAFFPTLASVLVLKVGEGSLKQSVHKAGMELLYLPIPFQVKRFFKPVIDVFIDNLATGVAGILLLIITQWLLFSTHTISLILIGLVAVWIFGVYFVHQSYITSIQNALKKKKIHTEELPSNYSSTVLIKYLEQALKVQSKRQVHYIIRLIGKDSFVTIKDFIPELLHFPSHSIALYTLKQIQKIPGGEYLPIITPMIQNQEPNISLEAMKYFFISHHHQAPVLEPWLQNPQSHLYWNALLCITQVIREQPENFRYLEEYAPFGNNKFNIGTFPTEQQEFIKTQTATLIQQAHSKKLYPFLTPLLSDPNPKVRHHAIQCAGKIGHTQFIPILVEQLYSPTFFRSIKKALTNIGPPSLDSLKHSLEDPNIPQQIHSKLPQIISEIGSSHGIPILLGHLPNRHTKTYPYILKALNSLFNKHSRVKPPQLEVENIIHKTLKDLYTLHSLEHNLFPSQQELENKEHPSQKLLQKTLEQKRIHLLKVIFELLDLLYPSSNIPRIYFTLQGNNKKLQSNSIELLDNILPYPIKKSLLPLLEVKHTPTLVRFYERFFNAKIENKKDTLNNLLKHPDNWIVSCTLFYMISTKRSLSPSQLNCVQENPDPLVQETWKLL